MDFDDIAPGVKIYWCKWCGPIMKEVEDILMENASDPEFRAKMERLVEEAEADDPSRS